MAIDGMNEWLNKIEQLKTDFPKETEKFVKMKAEEVIRETKKNLPRKNKKNKRTGNLRASWKRKVDKKSKDRFSQTVYSDVEYAAHVEYGHRIVRGNKTVGFVKGRRMLHKGLNRVRLTFYKDLAKLYKNLIEK